MSFIEQFNLKEYPRNTRASRIKEISVPDCYKELARSQLSYLAVKILNAFFVNCGKSFVMLK